MDAESDTMVVIQAVILMAYWHQSDDDNLSGSWHWMGIAISLCQTLGLYRNPIPANGDLSSDIGSSVWRRMWWACVARDSWLSLGYGKPLRINQTDNKVPLLSPNDILHEISKLPSHIQQAYIPEQIEVLCQYYIYLLELSLILGDLSTRSQTDQVLPLAKVERLESNLARIDLESKDLASRNKWASTDIVELADYHFEVCYIGVYITLWRPYLFEMPKGLPTTESQAWYSSVQRKMREAATRSNNALEKAVGRDMVPSLKYWTLTALIPMMQFYLIEIACCRTIARQLAKQKFDNCIMVLGEMKETYWQTGFVSLFFTRALEKILSTQDCEIQGTVQNPTASVDGDTQLGTNLTYSTHDSNVSTLVDGTQYRNMCSNLDGTCQENIETVGVEDFAWYDSQKWDAFTWLDPS